MEERTVRHPESGTPQGGVISPVLANIYLHEVLDVWFEREVKPRLKGRVFLVRYADDAVLGFSLEEDARRVLEVLSKRFANPMARALGGEVLRRRDGHAHGDAAAHVRHEVVVPLAK